MEQEAKRLLIDRLDECLLEHAEAICADGAPAIKDVYELQNLSELHYYLKVEHEFTPAEVEALLQFKDPLNVARWCWEENTHAHSFPICELLTEIRAEQRFLKVETEAEEQNRKYRELMSLVGKDYYIYREKLDDCSNTELIDRAEEIAAAMGAYRYLAESHSLTTEEIDYLLRFNRPLVEFVKYWPTADMTADVAMELFVQDISSPAEERAEPPKSLRERLQNAAREVQNRPASEPARHDEGAR